MSRSHSRHASHSSQQPAGLSAGESEHAQPFPSEHRAGLLPDKYFRWRSGEITRLEAFSDVVFGFALTLLVVSLEVPRNYAELISAMRAFPPFAVCFAQLILIWRGHYIFSRRYGLEDGYTMFLNVVLLFVVLFYVYPLKFVFALVFSQVTGGDVAPNISWHQGSVLMRIYAAGFISVFALFALMYARAYSLRDALDLTPAERLQTRMDLQENGIMVTIGLISLALAFRSPGWSGLWYCVIGPALWLHGSIYGKRVRLLAEK